MHAIDLLDPYARWAALELLSQMAGAQPGPDERSALRGAELALGFPGATTLPGGPPFPEDLLLGRLSGRDRMLVFAACAWMMFADGIRERRESSFLAWLADVLQLGEDTARFLVGHARWVRTEHEGLSTHRELDLLLVEGARRIAAVEAAAAA